MCLSDDRTLVTTVREVNARAAIAEASLLHDSYRVMQTEIGEKASTSSYAPFRAPKVQPDSRVFGDSSISVAQSSLVCAEQQVLTRVFDDISKSSPQLAEKMCNKVIQLLHKSSAVSSHDVLTKSDEFNFVNTEYLGFSNATFVPAAVKHTLCIAAGADRLSDFEKAAPVISQTLKASENKSFQIVDHSKIWEKLRKKRQEFAELQQSKNVSELSKKVENKCTEISTLLGASQSFSEGSFKKFRLFVQTLQICSKFIIRF